MSRLADALGPLAEALAGTRWYVFGAQAVSLRGIPRAIKVLARRPLDLEDVRGLLAVGDVDVSAARDLLADLERALGQSDLRPRLDGLLRP